MNGLEERVETLVEAGREDLAADLLRAAYHSRGIDDVEFLTDDRVRVEAEPFRGDHDIAVDSDGSISVQADSHYRFVGDDVETEFRVRSLTDTELRTIRSTVRAHRDATDQEEDSPTATTATDDRTVLADGGRSDPSSSGVRERLSKVLNDVFR